MSQRLALLLSDIVDSTHLNTVLGDAEMARLWSAHDHLARGLMRRWRGREIGRSDGFLMSFPAAADAAALASAYHHELHALHPLLKARVGLHWGEVLLRPNSQADVEGGATPFEIDGQALPLAARVMAIANGGQTLATADLVAELRQPARSHGHWRFKGLSDPVEVFELPADPACPALPPEDGGKAYRVVRRGDEWLVARHIANNLGAERDRFVGRDDTLATLARCFDGGARLVTLMGVGGIGKTRTALRYARRWLGEYPGGVWFCDLSQATSADGLAFAMAQALDVPLGKGEPLSKLGTAIAGRGDCLLVLDNFEQLAAHAEASVGRWLAMAPQARFLVTSRGLLGVAGEQVCGVEPLSRGEAITLFRERAMAAGADLAAHTDAALVPLVDLLDGLPLALELAAARAPLMSPQQMLGRMRQRFRLLSTPGRPAERRTALRATLDWSWELLTVPERSALAQLSVFEGGFTLAAAEAVVRVGDEADDWSVADTLHGLWRNSLLRRRDSQRFDLLRSVQDYASERLAAASDQGQVDRRHWQYFASFDEEQAVAAQGADLDNLIAACQRAAAPEPRAAALALQAAWAVLRLRGPFAVALRLAEAIEAAGPVPADCRAAFCRVVGGAWSLIGDQGAARQHLQASLDQALRDGQAEAQALAASQLSAVELGAGQVQKAEALLQQALQLSQSGGRALTQIRVLNQLGAHHLALAQYSAAGGAYRQALDLAERANQRRWIGGHHGNLGTVALLQGRRDAARAHFEQALDLADDVGDRQWAGNTHCNFGLLLLELGDVGAAQEQLESALDVGRSIGHRRLEATALCNLGLAAEAGSRLDQAARHHHAALTVAEALADAPLAMRFAGYLGLCLIRQGDRAGALPQLERAAGLQHAEPVDPLAMGVMCAQQAVAALLQAEGVHATDWLERAGRHLAAAGVDAASEAGKLLAEARTLSCPG